MNITTVVSDQVRKPVAIIASIAVLLISVMSTTTYPAIILASATNDNIPEFHYPRQRPIGNERQKHMYHNVYDGNSPPQQQSRRGERDIIFNPDPLHPPPLVLRYYSLAQVCKEDLNKYCSAGGGGVERNDGLGLKSPYGKVAIACLNAHKNKLTADCRKWHEARNICSSELRAAAAFVVAIDNAGDEGDHRGGEEGEGRNQPNEEDGLTTRNRLVLKPQPGATGGCSEVCREHCKEDGSLLMCMRTIGREMRAITSIGCHRSDFAKSVVRSLKK